MSVVSKISAELEKSFQAFDVADSVVFEYIGFNAEKMVNQLLVIEPKVNVLTKEILEMFTFIILRGTNYEKAMKKMGESGVEKLRMLVAKYKIRVNAKDSDGSSITLSRLSACFPVVMYKVRKAYGTSLRVVGERGDMPAEYCFPGAPALFPKDSKIMFEKWMKWALSFNEVIGGDESKVESFGKIAWSSSVTSDLQRSEHKF